MTDAGRRRIDVSSEVHSRLDAESKRRNIPIRDLVEQAVTTMFDREAQAALSVRQQRERRHADRIGDGHAQCAIGQSRLRKQCHGHVVAVR